MGFSLITKGKIILVTYIDSSESSLAFTRSHMHRTYLPGIIARNQKVAAGNQYYKMGRHLKSEAQGKIPSSEMR